MRTDDVPDYSVNRGTARKAQARFWTVAMAVAVVLLVAVLVRPMLERSLQFLVNDWLVERIDDLCWLQRQLTTLRLWPWADR